jgi:hypothetical protein
METVKSIASARIRALSKSLGERFSKARKADVLFDMQAGNPKIKYS